MKGDFKDVNTREGFVMLEFSWGVTFYGNMDANECGEGEVYDPSG